MNPVVRILALFLGAVSSAVVFSQTFQSPRVIPVDGPAPVVSMADMNNDGRPDLIVQTGDTVTPNSIEIFLADSAGNYTVSAQVSLPKFLGYPCTPADVNGDKNLDLICAWAPPGGGNGTVAVYLGNGDGTLQSPISTSLGWIGIPNALFDVIAVGDFNNDGHIDAIVTTGPAGSWANFNFLLLGDGTGQFTAKSFFGNLNQERATIADVNGDGVPDLLNGMGPSIWLGKADGTFAQQFQYQFGDCVFADFEKTGKLSAACYVQGNTLQIFHQNPDGSLNTGSPVASISFPLGQAQFNSPLQAIDLNNDGILDLVLTSTDGLQVMLGKPGLQFGDPVPYAAGRTQRFYPATGWFADMDGDGNPDFVATGPGAVYISYGSANGSLDAPVLNQLDQSLYTSKAADFDGDGYADVVATGPNGIYFLHGKGDGTFASPVSVALPAGGSPSSVLFVGDFNGDGNKDFLVRGISTDSLLYTGNGSGTFAPAIVIPAQNLPGLSPNASVLVADIDHDGKDDILQVYQTAINAYLSQGDGTFHLVTSTFANSGNQNTSIALSDLNGDGKLDAIITLGDHAIVLTGSGDGSFSTTSTVLTIPSVDGINLITNIIPTLTTGDMDGDGKQDVALAGLYSDYTPDLYLGGPTVRYSDAVWVYYGNGDTTFSPPVSAGVFYDHSFASLTAAPLEAAGRSDLILAVDSFPPATLEVVPSHSDRTFGAPVPFYGGEQIESVQAVDFNHDGKLDLLVSDGSSWVTATNSFAVLLNEPVKLKGTLITNPQPSLAGKQFTATATLVPYQPQLGPVAGTVTFAVDGTPIGTDTLNGNVAIQAVSSNLTGGDHQIIAAWSGDDTFAPVSVSAVQHVMDYTLMADPSVGIQAGQTGSVGVEIKSVDGFADTLALSCGNLPAYATCTFTNSGPSLSSGQALNIKVTIATTSTTTQSWLAAWSAPLSLAIVPGGLFLLLRRRVRHGLLLILASLTVVTVSACGGGGGNGGGGATNPTPPSTSAGTYHFSVIAIGKGTQLQRTATVTLTVTP